MKVEDIADIIEHFAPTDLAFDYDNVGLLVGDIHSEVSGICVALDVSEVALDYCVEHGCNLLIVHHPIIFNPIRRVLANDYVGGLVLKAIHNKINIYAAHTNMDNAKGGINHTLAREIGLHNICDLSSEGGVYGDTELNLDQLMAKLRDITQDKSLRCYKSKDISTARVGIISGAGGRDESLIADLLSNNVGVYISGEFKYNIVLELVANNITVIEVGHYECEKIFIDIVSALLGGHGDVPNIHKCYCPPFNI